jgi:parallel beta-helix repeat protein
VQNLDTGKDYSTIQEAIDAPETLDGHEIFVASGIYHEHLTVNKSLRLIGEDQRTTIIDGKGRGKIVYVAANNVEVRNLNIRNGTFGLWLDNSSNSRIISNILQNGSYGIRLDHSRNSEIAETQIYGYTSFGIEIKSSGNSTLRDNSINDNHYNLGIEGNLLPDFINDIDASNTINGQPVHYLINQHNSIIDSSTFQGIGYLGIVNSTNIRVEDINVQDNKQGVLFAFITNSTIRNVNAKSNWNGIYVAHSSNISVIENTANHNFDYGIKFFNSSHSITQENNVDDNGWAGIGLFGSHNSTVDWNEANFNTYNLHLVYTNNSVITRNSALIKSGGYSIAAYYSHNNLICQNTFANSLLYVETKNWTRFTPRNRWDNGIEGNYWISYGGVDTDQDGIGDTAYVIGENNTDEHPLMGEFSEFTANLRGETYVITIISNSTISQFSFSPDDTKISFNAIGESDTKGFSRIGVPNALLQDLHNGSLSVSVNGEQPALERKWTDGPHTYFYFSYVNDVSDSMTIPWPIIIATSILITVLILLFLIFGKRSKTLSRS